MRLRFLPLFLAAACASKGGQGARGEGEKKVEVVVPQAPQGAAWRTARGVAWKEMLEDLADADVVCLSAFADAGETGKDVPLRSGVSPLDVPVLDYLYKRGRLHAIALDVYPRTAQAVLDDFSFGRIDEAELALACGVRDADRPVLAFARERRLPLLGLGVEPAILQAVEQGGLDALSEEQRRSLPAIHAADPKVDGYPLGRNGAMVRGLILDVAADVLVRWYRDAAPEGAQIAVLLAGRQPPRSLPERLHARSGKSYLTLVALSGTAEADDAVFAKSYADYVWFTGGQ